MTRSDSSKGRLTEEIIIPGDLLKSVEHEEAGGIVLFLGTVRNQSEAGKVTEIIYEAYSSMAEKKLKEIEEEAKQRWPVREVRIVHRTGRLRVGEVSVGVAVSAPHRAEAFEACRHIIERIKRDLPIWKKERLAVGKDVWVEG
jgi:molybdopterin synthase catalytic subunit